MAGTIKHEWNGTVLTITSDSGTSSADLQGAKGSTGARGARGLKGESGGVDGYTPQKGVDYYTDADQEEIIQQVIAALGMPVFGAVNADNIITLTGALAAGTYTIKYEDALGNAVVIGTLTTDNAPTWTNVLPMAINTDGSAFSANGYKTDTRLNSSGAESTSSAEGIEVSGFIPVKYEDTIYFENLKFVVGGERASACYICVYDSAFNFIGYRRADETGGGNYTVDENSILKSIGLTAGNGFTASLTNAAYFRISAEEITNQSIITVNEPIE